MHTEQSVLLSKPPVWVPSGETVRALYLEYRQEAIYHAKARNSYFRNATAAYLSGMSLPSFLSLWFIDCMDKGDGAAARKWSQKGREHDAMMRSLHQHAAEKIFASRNSSFTSDMVCIE
jgi:hypothetical protein